ncbi:MAG: hypothetical protein ABSG69_06280 [Candidatus Acidiferrum sp.]
MALLISLFALLLICIVGMALILASGTDSALTGNYHSATSVYYAALAGLEEGRGRMLVKSANYLPTALGLPVGSMPGPGQVWYIINPLAGETVAPWDIGTPTSYPDLEYFQEFTVNPPETAPNLQVANSVFTPPTLQQVTPGPIYKWVRVNTVTVGSEQAIGVNVNPNGTYLPTQPVLYANDHLSADAVPGGVPALEITALAAMPNGSQRMLQYVVAPITLGLSFPAALIMDGNNVGFAGAPPFLVTGNDTQSNNPAPAPNCAPTGAPVAAVGYTNSGDSSQATILAGISNPTGYTGSGATPSVQLVSLPVSWQSPAALNALVQTISQYADVNVPAANTPANPSIFPPEMSATNPITVVVNGDMSVNNWAQTGYGILVVTGDLSFGPHDSWDGIVLVIGKGHLTAPSMSATGSFFGAVVVAKTLDDSGNPTLGTTLGASSVAMTGGPVGSSGNSIYYSSCWINYVQSPITYKVLSFREIPQS